MSNYDVVLASTELAVGTHWKGTIHLDRLDYKCRDITGRITASFTVVGLQVARHYWKDLPFIYTRRIESEETFLEGSSVHLHAVDWEWRDILGTIVPSFTLHLHELNYTWRDISGRILPSFTRADLQVKRHLWNDRCTIYTCWTYSPTHLDGLKCECRDISGTIPGRIDHELCALTW